LELNDFLVKQWWTVHFTASMLQNLL